MGRTIITTTAQLSLQSTVPVLQGQLGRQGNLWEGMPVSPSKGYLPLPCPPQFFTIVPRERRGEGIHCSKNSLPAGSPLSPVCKAAGGDVLHVETYLAVKISGPVGCGSTSQSPSFLSLLLMFHLPSRHSHPTTAVDHISVAISFIISYHRSQKD